MPGNPSDAGAHLLLGWCVTLAVDRMTWTTAGWGTGSGGQREKALPWVQAAWPRAAWSNRSSGARASGQRRMLFEALAAGLGESQGRPWGFEGDPALSQTTAPLAKTAPGLPLGLSRD